uniref:Structural maintenance of chromosomes protein 5 n=2 Tax=Amphimedon queenslandica TaxID=400682 RepID=A0A1X7TU81_AMPQE
MLLSPINHLAFTSYPETSAELEDLIHEHQTQVQMHSSSLNDEEAATRQYEANESKIKELREQIEKEDEEYQNHEQNIEELKNRWLKPLDEMIKKINEKFSKFFRDMKCVGEVDLLKDETETDFKKYGVQIRVKFRSEESLHVLDARHQSGGERSVFTMLYLMALQDITNCPFRVVDEINQGMDSINERSVFNQIVRTVNQRDTPQYFVLTPKLLQGLDYSDSVTVHIIHNGLHMSPDVWDKKCLV